MRGIIMKREEKVAWQRVYDLGKQVKEYTTKENSWATTFILVSIEALAQPVIVNVLAGVEENECYGLTVHHTEQARKSLFSIYSEDNFLVDELSVPPASQEGLAMFFSDREHVSKEQYNLIKALDLKFRGKNNWIYFESAKIGKITQQLNLEEVNLLIAVYEQVLIAINLIRASTLRLGEDFWTAYVLKQDNGGNVIVKEDIRAYYPSIEKPELTLVSYQDDILLRRLKNCHKINIDLELTYFYGPVTEDDMSYAPILIGGIRQTGRNLLYEVLDTPEAVYKSLIDWLVDFIIESGKPQAIYIRLWDLEEVLTNFCQKVGIKLIIDPDLENLDLFTLMMPF